MYPARPSPRPKANNTNADNTRIAMGIFLLLRQSVAQASIKIKTSPIKSILWLTNPNTTEMSNATLHKGIFLSDGTHNKTTAK